MADTKTSAEPVTITTIAAGDLLRVSQDLGGGIFGNAKLSGDSLLAQLAAANKAWSTIISTPTTLAGYGITDALIFKTISVAGQSDVVADSSTDVLTLIAGSNVTITTDAANDTITIASSGGGSGITQLTSDVTAGPGSGSQAATIAANAVTNAKLAQMADQTIKGNNAGSTGNALDLTASQTHSIVAPFIRGIRNYYTSGWAYGPMTLNTTANSIAANTVFFCPVYMFGDTVIASIDIRVTIGASGNTVVGVYADSGGRPTGSPLGQGNAFAATATGLIANNLVSAAPISNMQACWLAYHSSAAVTMQTLASANTITLLGRSNPADWLSGNNIVAWTQSTAYSGTLPAVSALVQNTGNHPAMMFIVQ